MPPIFRIEDRILARLASEKQSYGNLMLTPEQQADFVSEQPGLFASMAAGKTRDAGTDFLSLR
jgi:hypothetical protein